MDPLQPIILQHPDSPAVHALTRVDPTHPDGRGNGGQDGGRRQKRRQEDEDAVQVQLDGTPSDALEPEALEAPQTPVAPALSPGDDGRPHIDLTA